jgi:ribosomal RNA-processing protein 1
MTSSLTLLFLPNPDRKTRTAALASLRTFLSASTTARTLTDLEHRKLWSGLFYALYMCDRPLPQQVLCADLAALLDVLPDAAVPAWLAAFWDVVARRWTTGIDVLRMEKFLLLVRRVLARSLAWVHEDSANSSTKTKTAAAVVEDAAPKRPTRTTRSRAKAATTATPEPEPAPPTKQQEGKEEPGRRAAAMLALFRQWPFEPTGDLKKMPPGLRLHVLDIWVDEAEKVGLLGEEPAEGEERTPSAGDAAFLQGLRVIIERMVKKTVDPVKSRAKEGLADERLPWNEKTVGDEDEEMTEADDDDERGWGGFRD